MINGEFVLVTDIHFSSLYTHGYFFLHTPDIHLGGQLRSLSSNFILAFLLRIYIYVCICVYRIICLCMSVYYIYIYVCVCVWLFIVVSIYYLSICRMARTIEHWVETRVLSRHSNRSKYVAWWRHFRLITTRKKPIIFVGHTKLYLWGILNYICGAY